MLVEITEQKRVEERLRIAQSAGRVGAFEHVPGFATVAASPQFCSLLGLVPSRTVAASAVNALVVEGDPPLMAPDQRQEGELPPIETRVRLADSGEVRWLVRRGEAIRDTETSGLRHVGVIYDVTDSKRAEGGAPRAQRHPGGAGPRGGGRARAGRGAAAPVAEDGGGGPADGGIAHDFNNLLTGIVGSLDLMQTRINEGRTENLTRYAGLAMASAQRAAALTHRLLAFSRRQPLESKSIRRRQPAGQLDGRADAARSASGSSSRWWWPAACG